jgi:multidrug efflux system outer membrane protein
MRGFTVLVAATIVSLAACRTIETKVPPVELPEASVQSLPDVERWWTQFNDPQLNELIDEAFAANLDLGVAMARIEEARANLGVARSFLFPRVDAYANADRTRRSNATDLSFPGPLTTNLYSVGVQASYEVDLSGRISAGVSAAQSTLLATRYNTEAVRTVLAAQVATTYFTLLALDAELQISRDTLVTREDAVSLQRQRYDAGLIGEYDFKLRKPSAPAWPRRFHHCSARGRRPSALATLAGRSARRVHARDAPAGLVQGAYVPECRSDCRRTCWRDDRHQAAEAQLASANARVAEARAQYFPSLVLTGFYGSRLDPRIYSGPALVWSIAGRALQPIFSGGQITAQVEGAKAREQQLELQYVQAVQSAFRDAHDALVAHSSARDSFVAQSERRDLFAQAFALAELRYRSGYVSYIDVLDTQRNLLEAERQRVLALRERQVALVDLYKAIGGGWSPEQFASAR